MMIKLNDKLHVAADQIKSLSINDMNDVVIVTMKDGEKHRIKAEYKQSVFGTYDAILKSIQSALEKNKCNNTNVY